MKTYEDQIKQLARMVLGRGGAVALELLKVYAIAAGAETLGGGWIRIPGQLTANAQGWRQFASFVLNANPDGAWGDVVRKMAIAAAEGEDAMRLPIVQGGLAGEVMYRSDFTPHRDADVILGELRALIEQAQTPPPAAPPAKAVTVGDDVDLADLTEAQEYLAKRIVKRAVYDTGKALLDVLDGWIEGAAENNESMGRRDADPREFHAADIRVMVNDAMRLMGAPEHRIPQAGE